MRSGKDQKFFYEYTDDGVSQWSLTFEVRKRICIFRQSKVDNAVAMEPDL